MSNKNNNEKKLSAEEILDRLLVYFNLKTYSELAQVLNIDDQTLRGWKYRNHFNIFKVYPYVPDINWHWLITGEGEMKYDKTLMQKLKATIEYLLNQINKLTKEKELLEQMLTKYITESKIQEEKKQVKSDVTSLNFLSVDDAFIQVPKIKEGDIAEFLKKINKGTDE